MLLAMGKKIGNNSSCGQNIKTSFKPLAEKKETYICTDNEKLSTHFSPQKFYQSRIFTNSVEGA